MKLIQKLAVVVMAVIVVSTAFNYLVLKATVTPSFVKLEQKTAKQNAKRVVDAIDSQLAFIRSMSVDWAQWTATYDYARDKNEGYEEENLVYASLTALSLNTLIILDASNKVVWGKTFDLGSGEEIEIPELSKGTVKIDKSLLHKPDSGADDIHAGLFMTSKGPLLLSSSPILTSESEGPSAGSFIFGRLLTDDLINKLREQTGVQFEITNLTTATPPGDVPADAEYLLKTGDDNLMVHHTLKDIAGSPVITITARTAREITAVGQQTLLTALLALLGASAIVLLASGVIVQTIAISPIRSLTHTVLAIARTGNLKQPVAMDRKDEIGILSQEFQSMLTEVASVRDQIAEQSYLSGITQTLADIMHNVKNALNPIPLNVELWVRRLANDRNPRLLQAVAELQKPDLDPERREKLCSYLTEALNEAAGERTELTTTLRNISAQSLQIEEILDEQSNVDEDAVFSQELDVAALFQAAQLVIPEDANVEIAMQLEHNMAPAFSNPVILKQVLGNVFVNAHEAIAAQGVANGKIHCNASVVQRGGQDFLNLSIEDNGEGITAENLKNIFTRGFSTRKQKAGGLGMHWCANNISRLGGSMSADSKGAGRGARIDIAVPLNVQDKKVA